jgi:hypothetical protein
LRSGRVPFRQPPPLSQWWEYSTPSAPAQAAIGSVRALTAAPCACRRGSWGPRLARRRAFGVRAGRSPAISAPGRLAQGDVLGSKQITEK